MSRGGARRRATTVVEAARYAWLTESDVQVAGCVTVVAGSDADRVSAAFGIDPAAPALDLHSSASGAAGLASVAAAGEAAVVVEENGFEGSREVVLAAASRGTRAASVFWNVNSMLVITCASRGRVVFAGEIDLMDDHEGVPRGLGRFVDLAQEDDVDVVAVGAAMVAAYTGVEFGPEVLTGEWRRIEPVLDEPPVITPEGSTLVDSHPDVLAALVALPPELRRPLTAVLAEDAASRASLADDPVVAEVVASVASGSPVVTPRFEDMTRRVTADLDRHGRDLNDPEIDIHDPRFTEQGHASGRTYWCVQALRHACAADDLSALLGVVECAGVVHATDELEEPYLRCVESLCDAPPEQWPDTLHRLPPRLSRADRQRISDEGERDRDQHRAAVAAADRRAEWNGIDPTPRMLRAGFHARDLAEQDLDLLLALDRLTDDELRDTAVRVAERLLDHVGVLDRPWLADHRAAMRAPLTSPEQVSDAAFEALGNDPDIPWSTHVDSDGAHVSEQYYALPVLQLCRAADAFEAAVSVVSTVHVALGPAAADLLVGLRDELG